MKKVLLLLATVVLILLPACITDGSVARKMLSEDVNGVLPKQSNDPAEYAYALIDDSGRMALGVKGDGTVELPKATIGDGNSTKIAGAEIEGRALPYEDTRYAVTDETGRKSELLLDGSGNVPNEVLGRWKERMDAIATDSSQKRIICWGDSLTGGWPTMLQDLVGESWTVFNAGVGGETVTSIAARQGAQVMLVNDITIPATTTPVLIASGNGGIPTSSGYGAHPMLQGGATTINPCTIAGISGNLTATFDDGFTNRQYFFTRLEAGDAVSITRPTPIITYASENLRGGTAVLYVGCNAGGYDTPEELVHLIRQMVEYGGYDQYVVLAYTKWRGTQELYAPFDKAFSLAFGRHFLNHRAYLTEYGLDDAGLFETAQDTLDIAAGMVPVSLRADDVHFNDAAKAIIARLIKEKLEELGCSFEIASLQDASEGGEDMAIVTKLPMTFTDTSLPKLKLYDPIEPEQGALLLLDAAHPLSTLGDGIPADNTVLASIIPSTISAVFNRAVNNSASADPDGVIIHCLHLGMLM